MNNYCHEITTNLFISCLSIIKQNITLQKKNCSANIIGSDTALHEFYLFLRSEKSDPNQIRLSNIQWFFKWTKRTNDEKSKTKANLLANISSIQLHFCLYSKSKSTWNVRDKKTIFTCEAEKRHAQQFIYVINKNKCDKIRRP